MGIFDRKPSPPRTFAEALMGTLVPAAESWDVPQEAPVQRVELTEKALVLESFTQYVDEKLTESPLQSLQFPGGEILRKEDENLKPLVPKHASFDAWRAAHAVPAALTAGKSQPLAVLFIGESLAAPTVPVEGVREEFLWAFPPPVAELFQKMVQAMKLAPHEYALTGLKYATGEKNAQELFEEAHWWQARFVVPLGAQALQALLGPRERLASAHGKSFPHAKLRAGSEIVPLFHPSVIATNANMKKSTWTDMQKIMKALGKA